MKKIAIGLLAIVVLLVLLALGTLGPAHRQIRRIAPSLPTRSAIDTALSEAAGPVSLVAVNSGSQASSEGGVVTHPAYLLEWSDGRRFLIDAGMEPDEVVAFGRPIELILGSDPAVPHGSVAGQLGKAMAQTVMGMAFTHLHIDHTQGIGALCRSRDARPLRVFQTPYQADDLNHTTRPGLAHIEASGCGRRERLSDATGNGLYPIPGFPGLLAVAGGGHTPGSTIFLARVGEGVWVMGGDVANFMESVTLDRPKEAIYSYLIVPEFGTRLAELRAWLRTFDEADGYRVAISHDLGAAVKRGMVVFEAASPGVRGQ